MISKITYNQNEKKVIRLIKENLKKNNVVILKNFLSLDEKRTILKFLKKSFNLRKDIRISGEFKYLQEDYKRLDVGDSYINSRFSRFILYNEWNNKNFFRSLNRIISFRNKVMKIKKEKFEYFFRGYNSKSYKFCDLVRMIQYPTGGGFLASHYDNSYLYPKKLINLLIPFSKRSKKKLNDFTTFETGGLYYLKKKKRLDLEKFLNVGDLVFHTQKIKHGVSSVDPKKPLNIDDLCGRITVNFSIGKYFL